MVKPTTIDRQFVDYPAGYDLQLVATGLTAPGSMVFDSDGTLVVAESGVDGTEPRIYGWKPDGKFIEIYPRGGRLTVQDWWNRFQIHGPVGGMIIHQGKIYISHRDNRGRGVITSLDYEGNHATIVADLPAQGDYGVTDLAMSQSGRIWFGVGTATNSGVVGPDNDWFKQFPEVCDQFYRDLITRAARFDTPNPYAGMFQPDLLVTSPFQPIGQSNLTRVKKAANGKPSGAIYSVSPNGGDLKVEAFGIHNPRGLAWNEQGLLYMTNAGMELRGTRPIMNDPDVFARVIPGTYYGWPDYSADFRPITDPFFQPPVELLTRTGYRELFFLIDHEASQLLAPYRSTLLTASFLSQSGATKFDFVPGSGPFKNFRGNAVVALAGDRAPFATSARPLNSPPGYKVVRVDVETNQVTDLLKNTKPGPASAVSIFREGLERPVDIKFGPDGAMYILDFGYVDNRRSQPRVSHGSGKIYKLVGSPDNTSARAR